MKRVIVVGPGAAGKTTLAARLAEITGLPVIELDKLFWQPGLAATPPGEWAAIQRTLTAQKHGSWTGTSGPMTSSASGCGPRTLSCSWTSRRCAVSGGPSAGLGSAPISGSGCWPTAATAARRFGGCYRPRRSPRRLCPPDSASGEAIRHEDSVRRACATLPSGLVKRHIPTPRYSRYVRMFVGPRT